MKINIMKKFPVILYTKKRAGLTALFVT